MLTAGIISEYNPFHNGHAYQLREIRRQLGCSHIVSVMGGDFMQRGVPAVCGKYTRAEMAVSSGVDAVFELPFSFATASARDFATAGVLLLDKLGCIDYLVFGAECDDLALLQEIAALVSNEPKEMSECIQTSLAQGMNFASARAKALVSCCKEAAEVITEPNNILAIEYLSALKKTGSGIKPYVIKRQTADYHDTSIHAPICSAAAIRQMLEMENGDTRAKRLAGVLPKDAAALFAKELGVSCPVVSEDLTSYLQYRLLMLKENPNTADMTQELYHKLKKADPYLSYTELCASLKTKEITLSRIRRALLHLLLDLNESDIKSFKEHGWVFYARLLGCRASGSDVLKQMKETAKIPVITKAADAYGQLSAPGRTMFDYDVTAANLYNHLVYTRYRKRIADDFTVRLPILP